VWGYPSDAVTQQIQGHLLLLFVLERSGQVTRVELRRSSGSKVLDQAAWEAVTKASPFDRFPPHIRQEDLRIRARFRYVLEAGQHRRRAVGRPRGPGLPEDRRLLGPRTARRSRALVRDWKKGGR
jgi:TonB family protein